MPNAERAAGLSSSRSTMAACHTDWRVAPSRAANSCLRARNSCTRLDSHAGVAHQEAALAVDRAEACLLELLEQVGQARHSGGVAVVGVQRLDRLKLNSFAGEALS